MYEIVVLCNNLRAGTRKVESECFLSTTQIVEFENEVLREIALVSPDDPAKAWIHQTEFVTGCVDGLDAWEQKVPLVRFSFQEWLNKASRSRLVVRGQLK